MKLIIDPLQLVSDQYTPETGEIVVTAAAKLKLSDYTPAILANLIERDIDLKTAQKYRIRQAAKEEIENMAWRIERAQERDKTGAAGELLIDVFMEREAIRKASNRIEAEIETLTDDTEIRTKTLTVIEADQETPKVLTKLQFLRRFTPEERITLRTARDSGTQPELEDWWDLIAMATSVTLTDTDVVYGVNALETAGLLEAGRATEILT